MGKKRDFIGDSYGFFMGIDNGDLMDNWMINDDNRIDLTELQYFKDLAIAELLGHLGR